MSKALQHAPGTDTEDGLRIPAREIEAAVCNRVAEALDDPWALLTRAGLAPEPDQIGAALANAEKLALAVRRKEYALMRGLVTCVTVTPRSLEIALSADHLAKALRLMDMTQSEETIILNSQVRLTKTGRAMRLVHSNGRAATAGTPDPNLVKLLALARRWSIALATGQTDMATIARTEKVSDSWVTRVVRLSFLAPEIVDAILEGTQPERLTATTIVGIELPFDWSEQVKLLLAA